MFRRPATSNPRARPVKNTCESRLTLTVGLCDVLGEAVAVIEQRAEHGDLRADLRGGRPGDQRLRGLDVLRREGEHVDGRDEPGQNEAVVETPSSHRILLLTCREEACNF